MAAECFVAGAAAFQVYSLLDWLRGRLAAPIPPPQTPADLIVITGASRGYGQAVAVALAASSDGTGRTMVLTARTAGGLDHTAALVEKSGGGKVRQCCPQRMFAWCMSVVLRQVFVHSLTTFGLAL